MKTTDWIVPVSDLQENLATIIKNAKQRPLVVTDEGRPSLYVLSVDLFDTLVERLSEMERAELEKNLAEGESQFATGASVTLKEALAAAEAKWQVEEVAS